MTALTRRSAAATFASTSSSANPYRLWHDAARIRQEWLAHGLSTQPSDRTTAERCITTIYARAGRSKPRFEWVDSPHKALPLIGDLPTLDQLYQRIRDPRVSGPPPLASDVAMAVSQLRGALSEGVVHPDPELSPVRRGKSKDPWPELPPVAALDQATPLHVVLHQGIRTALYRSLGTGLCQPVRQALTGPKPLPVCWYGQQDASWIGYYDTLERLGLARYEPHETEHFTAWTDLARSTGWWWPGEHVCVMVERPMKVATIAVPGTWHDEVRLDNAGVRYRDGWCAPG